MPKVTKIYGGNESAVPLKATFKKKSGKKAACIIVRCPCGCKGLLVICPADNPTKDSMTESIGIGGVIASVAQWRELLCPILGIHNSPIH